ncbi:MAG: response regulator transcription factor [Deltaproteobacteria bacterium]|nr:response regulator transcription factor [Deltaproteobacteria bacterium]MBW2562916.1 response regulator transcription factor [Deltaproteobacteria bacterium]
MNNLNQTVYVVDDDASVRRGLIRLLKSAGYSVESFDSAQAFLDADPSCQDQACLILDMKMPGMTGSHLQQKLLERDYAVPIIFITGHGDVPMSVKAMKTGAVDFLTKPFDEGVLLGAVEEALKKDIKTREAIDERQSLLKKIEALTPREHEIFTYVITGMLNKQIAYTLNISEKTVKVHRGRVMEKLSLDSVAQLVRMASKAGIPPAEVPE